MAHRSQLATPLYSLSVNGSHMWVKCWRITRVDGTVFRFTDHSVEVTLNGAVYTPIGGFRASAEEGESGLSPGNRELLGVIRSDRITEDDLRAGRYRGAQLEEFIVDSRFPWAGIIRRNRYWIQEARFSGERWEAQIDGPLNKLRVTVGFTYERRCRWVEFGDPDTCAFDLDTERVSGASVSTIVTARKTITTDVATGKGDDFYNNGKITWLGGGANAGLISDVKDYIELTGIFTLYVEPPFDIQVGDTFDLVPGCDRQFSTCVGFNNKDNFGGFKDIPGNDDTFTTPSAVNEE